VAHLALYREFRPQTFAAVVGQKHITRTLQNALAQGKLHHAYLFAGPRGTGKTSVARLVAKAANCLELHGGEPCNACAACRQIMDGQTMDVIEIDAASNRQIDDVRDLRDKVKYAPTDLRYKVYIIDEVHMLTEAAFNALLKTLEEPPAHVIFVLATTDAHKVPITITSRCQRFEFHRLAQGEIVQQLEAVCQKYSLRATPEALAAIARQAEGGMRDALSLLDQVMAYLEEGQTLTLEDTLTVLGAADNEVFGRLDQALQAQEVSAVLAVVEDLMRRGKDVQQFVRDYLGHLRDLLLVQVGAAPDAPQQHKDLAAGFSREFLLGAVAALAQLESDLRYATAPRLLLEVALIRMATGLPTEQAAPPVARAPAAARPGRAPAPPAPGAPASAGQAPAAAPDAPAAAAAPAVEESAELAAIVAAWPRVMERVGQLKRSVAALLDHARPYKASGGTLWISFEHAVHGEILKKPENATVLEKALMKEGLGEWRLAAGTGNDVKPIATGAAGAKSGGKPGGKTVKSSEQEPDPLKQRLDSLFGADVVEMKEDA
jgi:DNA polymerase-3 subunit gamma/tau